MSAPKAAISSGGAALVSGGFERDELGSPMDDDVAGAHGQGLRNAAQSAATFRLSSATTASHLSGAKMRPPSPPLLPPPLSLQYYDRFLARPMRIPFDQRAQIDALLHVIEAAAARFHFPRGYPLAHEHPQSPSGYTRVSLWPAQLQRAAIGFAAAASHWLATAPASVGVSARTAWCWRTCILIRVMGGYVGKIQVHVRVRGV